MPLARPASAWSQPGALWVAGVALFACGVALLVLSGHLGALEALGVPTMQPPFADVRTIAGAGVALEQGLDPLVQNPGDPWGRAMNYPRVWLVPAMSGLRPEHAPFVAYALFACFAGGLLLLRPLATTRGTTALLLLVLLSPVTLLAIERANTDLLAFALLAAAAWLSTSRPWFAAVVVGVASALKLFPIFGLAGLLRGDRRAVWPIVAVAVAFVVYLVCIRSDLALIAAHSQRWHPISYGIELLPKAAADLVGWNRTLLLVLAAAFLGLVAVVGFVLRRRWQLGASATPHALAAFRIGAGVLVGTFCLGSNFDYRLVVLLLVVPQLVRWCGVSRGTPRSVARALLGILLLVVWSMAWRQAFVSVGMAELGHVTDELLTWALVSGLLVALVLGAPDWLVPAGWRGRPMLDG